MQFMRRKILIKIVDLNLNKHLHVLVFKILTNVIMSNISVGINSAANSTKILNMLHLYNAVLFVTIWFLNIIYISRHKFKIFSIKMNSGKCILTLMVATQRSTHTANFIL